MEQKTILFDAKGEILGRLSSEVARVLSGKDRVDYAPNVDNGARVVVINSDEIVLTGAKEKDKKYYHHTGYSGGIKEINVSDQRKKDSTWLIEHAVKGMLPKNKLAKLMMKHLHVYADDNHKYEINEKGN